jgi:hypothetical protein
MNIFQTIIMRLFPNPRKTISPLHKKPQDLPPEIMAKVLGEVKILQQQHGVEVRSVSFDKET